ncbi:SDR family NAD(P)-dependent oxidoreductase [Allokutzneria sp. NRRL B-24872]|uniref:SDR family NAD(P)-dependent oxidoreductase n=1 Tax=Allokutzneria sp. NRRL B-24872 TaxID=1137961 RepID=UPI000A3A811A|nr:3-oxoacyl-ACP reductase family protein [Allokutzneria sp. NRRL B-24872]
MLAGKKALVTGGSRGIGAAIALRLAELGADVAITYASAKDRAEEVVGKITATGRRGLAIAADNTDSAAVLDAVDRTAAELGGLDVLVNNAGIFPSGVLGEVSEEEVDRTLAVHVRAVYLASQAALKHMGEGGRIISIGSNLAERVPFPGVALYAMSKAALLGFTRGAARDLGPRGITVNLVQPGPTDTDMNPADAEGAEYQRSMTAFGRFADAREIAETVAHLASPGARNITGSVITLDGGTNA